MRRLIALTISLGLRAWDVLVGALFSSKRNAGVVLYYHAVKPHQRHRFALQMDELLRRAHPFRADLTQPRDATRNLVAVTFDDGFRSVVENAMPELARRSIPFTIFVPSGCLGERPSWVHDPNHASFHERVLSAQELRNLANVRLATIGSHSISHPNLLELEPSRATHELAGSRQELSEAAGVAVDLFSFPHGAHNEWLVEEARRVGYRRVFTIEPTTVDGDHGSFVVGRVAADPDDWPLEFRLKLAGAYRWRRSLHRLRQLHESVA